MKAVGDGQKRPGQEAGQRHRAPKASPVRSHFGSFIYRQLEYERCCHSPWFFTAAETWKQGHGGEETTSVQIKTSWFKSGF